MLLDYLLFTSNFVLFLDLHSFYTFILYPYSNQLWYIISDHYWHNYQETTYLTINDATPGYMYDKWSKSTSSYTNITKLISPIYTYHFGKYLCLEYKFFLQTYLSVSYRHTGLYFWLGVFLCRLFIVTVSVQYYLSWAYHISLLSAQCGSKHRCVTLNNVSWSKVKGKANIYVKFLYWLSP